MNASRCLSLLALAASLLTSGASAAESPLRIRNRAQLAADKTWVHSSAGVAFTLHPGEKHPQPVLRADQPWEGWRINLFGTVLFDAEEQLFKMWYASDTTADFPIYATCYATSRDGLAWEKPRLGAIASATGGRDHNAVLEASLIPSVIKDRAEPDPQRRYKMVTWVQKTKPAGGPHTFVSPDGLHWTKLSEAPICRSSDVITAFYDEERRMHVAFPKLQTPVRGNPPRRCFGLSTSRDFLTWTEPRYVFTPDLRDDAGTLARLEESRSLLDVPDEQQFMRTEFYGIGAYEAESCTLAFPWVFSINNNARFGNHEGPSEVQFAVSRDLENWDRSFRTPVIPHGRPDEWDAGFLCTASRALRVRDEVWLYYGGANYTHGTPALYREEGTGRGDRYTNSIGLVKWKLDRFVSADALAGHGTITSVPATFEGTRLELNAATREGGTVEVELLDLHGKVLARSQPVSGNGVRLPVGWPEGTAIEQFAGKPTIVRLHLHHASLFAFAFRE